MSGLACRCMLCQRAFFTSPIETVVAHGHGETRAEIERLRARVRELEAKAVECHSCEEWAALREVAQAARACFDPKDPIECRDPYDDLEGREQCAVHRLAAALAKLDALKEGKR